MASSSTQDLPCDRVPIRRYKRPMYRTDINDDTKPGPGARTYSGWVPDSFPAAPGPIAARQTVDYALRRRGVLRDLRAGRTTIAQVCDADRYLVSAARFHGTPTDETCPVCRDAQLTRVSWVYGDKLGDVSGSARSEADIAELAGRAREFSVHIVEVCLHCRWNHLVQSYVAGLPPAPPRRRRKVAAH